MLPNSTKSGGNSVQCFVFTKTVINTSQINVLSASANPLSPRLSIERFSIHCVGKSVQLLHEERRNIIVSSLSNNRNVLRQSGTGNLIQQVLGSSQPYTFPCKFMRETQTLSTLSVVYFQLRSYIILIIQQMSDFLKITPGKHGSVFGFYNVVLFAPSLPQFPFCQFFFSVANPSYCPLHTAYDKHGSPTQPTSCHCGNAGWKLNKSSSSSNEA